MKYFLLFLIILVFCIAPISAEKNKGLFSGDILQADLDAFTANTSDIPSYVDDGTPEETKLQDIAEWVNIGKTQLKSGNWAAAEEAFSKVTEQDSINNDGWEGYLLAIRGGGDFDKLLAVAEDATKKNPRYSSAWKYKGIALSGLNKSDEALSAFDKVLEMDPSNYQAWYYKGIAFDNLKQYNEAVNAYDQVLKINPDYAKGWNNKGVALNYLERYDEAIAAFDKASELDPGLEQASGNKELLNEEKKKKSLGTMDIIDDASLIIPSVEINPSLIPTTITTPSTNNFLNISSSENSNDTYIEQFIDNEKPTTSFTQAKNLIKIVPGWNHISIPMAVTKEYRTVSKLFKGIQTGGTPYAIFDNALNEWVNISNDYQVQPLETLRVWKANSGNIEISLKYKNNEVFTRILKPGWNGIGIMSDKPLPAKEALKSLEDNWVKVLSYNPFTQRWEYPIIRGFDDYKTLEPTIGYLIEMKNDGILSGYHEN